MSFVFASSISSSLYPSMKLLYNKGMVSRFSNNMKSFSAGEWRQKPLIYEDVEKH